MSWFKRLCLFVFGVSGVLALAALSLTWVGPWTTIVRSYFEQRWFYLTLAALVGVSGFGLLVCVLVALFAPRNPKETIVASVSGGQIIVTRAAVASQAKHVVEADGSCAVSQVGVRMGKRGNVRVSLRVTPHWPVDVAKTGERLQMELQEGLARVCGDGVRSVRIVFAEPEQPQIRRHRDRAETDSADAAQDAAYGSSIVVPMGNVVQDASMVDDVPVQDDMVSLVVSSGDDGTSEPEDLSLLDADGREAVAYEVAQTEEA